MNKRKYSCNFSKHSCEIWGFHGGGRFKSRSSESWRRVVLWYDTSVPEAHAAFMFGVERPKSLDKEYIYIWNVV